jgi:hypothetical protein
VEFYDRDISPGQAADPFSGSRQQNEYLLDPVTQFGSLLL